jgi:hypothetical protein
LNKYQWKKAPKPLSSGTCEVSHTYRGTHHASCLELTRVEGIPTLNRAAFVARLKPAFALQSRLSRSGWSHHGGKLSAGDHQIQVLQHRRIAVVLGQVFGYGLQVTVSSSWGRKTGEWKFREVFICAKEEFIYARRNNGYDSNFKKSIHHKTSQKRSPRPSIYRVLIQLSPDSSLSRYRETGAAACPTRPARLTDTAPTVSVF